MNFLRRTPLSGVRSFALRGHGPSHGPDGFQLGQAVGTTLPFSTAQTAKPFRVGLSTWGYFVAGIGLPTWAVWYSANKEAK
jgi:hypothetical protein